MYPGQLEIHAYLKRCVENYGLASYMRLKTRFCQAVWDESQGIWNASTADGIHIRARVLVSGMGALHVPHFPAIKGLESFQGPAFHSATWDHNVYAVGMTGCGTNKKNCNASFVDPTHKAGNVDLSSSDTCAIDYIPTSAGTYPATDIHTISRPQGGSVDAGANEYVVTAGQSPNPPTSLQATVN